MATAETLVWYDRRRQRFISPVTVQIDLQAVLDAVPTAELLAHPLAYQPQRAASDAPPGYQGVWRAHTVTFAGQSAQLRLLVVHSASKARLDAQKRQEALAKLQQRLAAIQTHLNQRKYKRRDYTGSKFIWPSVATQPKTCGISPCKARMALLNSLTRSTPNAWRRPNNAMAATRS